MRRARSFLLALAVVGLLVGPVLLVAAFATSTCREQTRQWDALHRVIEAAFTPPAGYHLTPEQRRLAGELRGRLEAAQGDRPTC